ncbi:DUF6766 family protein [Vulcaniibacterium tengchongense]|uniref:Transmembrane protein n=1 Tax=Vulcaniibacterium tengchongense TaxID=1273429 RepID=A0A3N4W3T3_9GAMM|nr:DUF6766 family protein [Vulcaniibacterium tengchongense]RPE79864.1 hypothetical protein EDC50_1693 [Vulcaniibacterium tengchongense]
MEGESVSEAPGFVRRNGLSLVLLALFLASFAGQAISGRMVLNRERLAEGEPPVGWLQYFGEGQFVSATFENWESEFLQMGVYVLLTVWLRQWGSAESRPFGKEPPPEIEPGPTPWPVKVGGWVRKLYENSLSIALLGLFACAFVGHWLGSWEQNAEEMRRNGEAVPSHLAYLADPQFWFESFQNWQSEFLAVFALVMLSIVLRQHDSPQSKPVEAPHSQTGA